MSLEMTLSGTERIIIPIGTARAPSNTLTAHWEGWSRLHGKCLPAEGDDQNLATDNDDLNKDEPSVA
ncbi:uncharacterized protein N7525_009700 [Penicillium rubens]|jgi:hypothetical protein|uniref:uncharacterized protein n=1 Tax=Penicillium rubens TaxID=1108849 RepID=UPI002A5A4CC1|nr:uncharacterized protein N7525_009700 [Penicillium rubens]KAJ5831447.1 hypothetical protein N7525_009700 [Penicillium rubens]KAJ5854990.1 hypothetical protein N7534_007533 [Penicillium rubens]